jgi:alpha-glucosidase
VIAGPRVADVTRAFTRLTGRPAFLPRWGLGYSGSTMTYTDAPNAQERMGEFLDGCATHDILCSSFHLSSGYTSIGPRRYVFTWNRDKFPDPGGFIDAYRTRGVHLCANVKPCLLRDHPRFEEARRGGLLVSEEDGAPALVQFWGEIGAYLDFTNPATLEWWRAQVRASLLDLGIAATWNDNNEFEILSPRARAAGFGAPFPAREAKPLQTLLMLRASRDAQRAHAPGKRPFLITRAGAAGMQRYAQTWSGDNSTSWETLRYNLKMGLGLALSGVSNAGHDVGGFSGDAPDPELFVRWVEAGIFQPRFSIHSWNDDGTVNEPWMHPEATAQVRALIKLRAALTPYLYDLSWRYAHACEPITRPLFYDFPDDPLCRTENDEMMLGPDLLVAPVVSAGRTTRALYLPAGVTWREFRTGARHAGGQRVDLPAPLGQPALLARDGCAIALNIAEQHFASPAEQRAFLLFAPDEGRVDASAFEDDGESEAWRDRGYGFWRLRAACGPGEIVLAPGREGPTPPPGRRLTVLMGVEERRAVRADGARIIEDVVRDGRRAVLLDLG